MLATSHIVLVTAALSALPIPPGLETDIQRLFETTEQTQPLPAGWYVGDILIDHFAVRVSLEGPASAGTVTLMIGEMRPKAQPAARTASFTAWLDEDAAESVRPAAQVVLANLALTDDGTILEKVERNTEEAIRSTSPPTAATQTTHWRTPSALESGFRLARWCALIGLLIGLGVAATRRRRLERRALLLGGGLVLLFGLALVLRMALPAWAPLHANDHGIDELRGLGGFVEASKADMYGFAHRQVVRFLLSPLRPGVTAPLALNAVFGALAVVAVAILARTVTSSWLGGAIAGVALAVHPANVILSLSESPWPLAVLLVCTGCIAGVRALAPEEPRATLWLWLAALSLACASELRVYTILLPLVAVLVIGGAIALRRPTVRLLHVLAATAMLVATLLPHGLRLTEMAQHNTDRVALGLGAIADGVFTHKSLLTNLDLAPIGSSLLAALALVHLLINKRLRLALALACAFAAMWLPSTMIAACRTDLIRYQSAAQWLMCLLSAGVLLKGRRITAVGPKVVAALSATIIIATAAPGLVAARTRSFPEAAFLLVEEAAPTLPAEVTVLVPPERVGSHRVVSDFPDYLLEAAGKNVAVTPPAPPPAAGDNCYVYLAPACYRFAERELADSATRTHYMDRPIRPTCADLFARAMTSSPAATVRALPVPWRATSFHPVPARQPLVGLAPCRPVR